jgi:hypothetical protein
VKEEKLVPAYKGHTGQGSNSHPAYRWSARQVLGLAIVAGLMHSARGCRPEMAAKVIRFFEAMTDAEIDAWLAHDDEVISPQRHSEAGTLYGLIERQNEEQRNAIRRTLPDQLRTQEDISAKLAHVEPIVRLMLADERDGIDRDFGPTGRIRSLRAPDAVGGDRALPWMEAMRNARLIKVEHKPIPPHQRLVYAPDAEADGDAEVAEAEVELSEADVQAVAEHRDLLDMTDA